MNLLTIVLILWIGVNVALLGIAGVAAFVRRREPLAYELS